MFMSFSILHQNRLSECLYANRMSTLKFQRGNFTVEYWEAINVERRDCGANVRLCVYGRSCVPP